MENPIDASNQNEEGSVNRENDASSQPLPQPQANPVPETTKNPLPKVEIIRSGNPKPYLGGFKSLKTGLIYHHAFAQTDQIARDHKTKFHRDVSLHKFIDSN